MKKANVSFLICFLLLTAPSSLQNINYCAERLIDDSLHIELVDNLIEHIEVFNQFAMRLGALESTNNYRAINGSYVGKYQFGNLALADLGMPAYDKYSLLYNPELQDRLFFRWLSLLHNQYLQTEINLYTGLKVKDIFITPAGILAGGHLGGSGSVKRFLRTNGRFDFADANNTHVSRYIYLFSDLTQDFRFDIVSEDLFIKYRKNPNFRETLIYNETFFKL